MNELDIYKHVVLNNCSLQYGKLTLCDLTLYGIKERQYKYQLYCDDRKLRPPHLHPKQDWYCHTKMYRADQLDEAIKDFVAIKNRISPKVK